MASVFDLLDEIRKRPGMYVGYDESKRALQLQTIETLMDGYRFALQYHNINEPVSNFNSEFGDYLRETKGWCMACGPVVAILRAAKNEEGAWKLYWMMVDEFRATVKAA
jgi:hypothetical protein